MWRSAICLLLVTFVPSVQATATVFEITSDGSIVVHDLAKTPAQPARSSFIRPFPATLVQPLALASERASLADDLIAAIAWVESRYQLSARSPAGAVGIMQLMPATARDLGVDPYEPDANLTGGAAYLRQMLDRYDGDLVRAIAAYNAGPGAVDRHRGVPPYPETRRYVAAVLARLSASALGGAQP